MDIINHLQFSFVFSLVNGETKWDSDYGRVSWHAIHWRLNHEKDTQTQHHHLTQLRLESSPNSSLSTFFSFLLSFLISGEVVLYYSCFCQRLRFVSIICCSFFFSSLFLVQLWVCVLSHFLFFCFYFWVILQPFSFLFFSFFFLPLNDGFVFCFHLSVVFCFLIFFPVFAYPITDGVLFSSFFFLPHWESCFFCWILRQMVISERFSFVATSYHFLVIFLFSFFFLCSWASEIFSPSSCSFWHFHSQSLFELWKKKGNKLTESEFINALT